jgi:prepilin peptidase CpaA
MNVPLWVAAPVVVIATLAARADVRTRRIPNHLVFPAIVIALVSHLVLRGPSGLADSATGMALVGVALLPGWFMRWMGAGDVKLVAALGAWLGMPLAVVMLLLSLIAGGVCALVLAVRRRVLVKALQGAATLGTMALAPAGRPDGVAATATGIRFPFALAVFAGAAGTLMWPA